MRIRGLGVTAPYVGLLIVRLLFVLLLPLMPETLPVRPLHDDASETINSSSDDGDVKPAAFASRFLAAPIALLQPFRVLVPAKVDGRRSYQLPLIAASYALLMIVPGLVRPPSYRAGAGRRADSGAEADQCPSFAGSGQDPLRPRHLRLGSCRDRSLHHIYERAQDRGPPRSRALGRAPSAEDRSDFGGS